MALIFENAVIIPTGDEIKSGIVLDTDSPEIIKELLKINGGCTIKRLPPIIDNEHEIIEIIKKESNIKNGLIVLIGGSGGGHRFSSTLGKDFTHSALSEILSPVCSYEIYGKNGHMWCKLVCGYCNGSLVINVPGPFEEAKAAIKAFSEAYQKNDSSIEEINKAMVEAVKEQYF